MELSGWQRGTQADRNWFPAIHNLLSGAEESALCKAQVKIYIFKAKDNRGASPDLLSSGRETVNTLRELVWVLFSGSKLGIREAVTKCQAALLPPPPTTHL